MKAVSISELKSNPSAALREAREHPVMVLNRGRPEAVLVHLEEESGFSATAMRCAIATALYRERSLSLGGAARFSGIGLSDFITHVSLLGIPVVDGDATTVDEDVKAIEAWRNASS